MKIEYKKSPAIQKCNQKNVIKTEAKQPEKIVEKKLQKVNVINGNKELIKEKEIEKIKKEQYGNQQIKNKNVNN